MRRGHIPHGMCGLKWEAQSQSGQPADRESHPSRDVWIEMGDQRPQRSAGPLGHIPHGMCGLKWSPLPERTDPASSHPSRDVWIEMLPCSSANPAALVTSLTGCVD